MMRRRVEATQPSEGAEPSDFLPLPHLPFHVLLALSEGPQHGWGVVKRIGELTDGSMSPSSGSLYLAMSRLEERGLLDRSGPDAESGRRVYRLSPLGRRVLDAEVERLAGLLQVARGRSGGALPGGEE